MLHELLLALQGIPGGVFVESKSALDDESYFNIELKPAYETLPFTPAGELSLHTELIKLGSIYRGLEYFVRRYAGPFQGLYLSSFASGIDSALKDYRSILCSIEEEIIANPAIGVSHIVCRLHPFKLLLPVLIRIVKKVENAVFHEASKEIISSCKIIDIIISAAPMGLPEAFAIVRKILDKVMTVFYRQLSSWLLYGVLHDPHNEFFIYPVSSKEINRNDDTFGDHSENNNDNEQAVSKLSFKVDHDRVPLFLPSSFAQRVLSAGEAIFSAAMDSTKSSLLMDVEQLYAGKFNDLLDGTKKTNQVENENHGLYNLNDADYLHNLVCDVQRYVSHRAWSTLINEHNLIHYLRLLKEILLLGRGELCLAFLDQVLIIDSFNDNLTSSNLKTINDDNVLDRSPPTTDNETKALEFDIMEALLSAARSIGIDDDELDCHFKFSITSTSRPVEHSSSDHETVSDCLNLNFIAPSTLEYIFTHQVLRAYNNINKFLFNIRRTQLKLQQYWADQILCWRHSCAPHLFSNKSNSSLSKQEFGQFQSVIDRRLLIRNHMAFIIENLQYYLQVDVIDSHFSHLIRRIQNEQELESIQIAHEAYLASLQAQALLFHPNAKRCILDLLKVCRKYVRIATGDNSTETSRRHEHERLLGEFQQNATNLFTILHASCAIKARTSVCFKSTQNSNAGLEKHVPENTDLSQLLLRLDFNYFYSDYSQIQI